MELKMNISRDCLTIKNENYLIHIHDTFVVVRAKDSNKEAFCYTDGHIEVK